MSKTSWPEVPLCEVAEVKLGRQRSPQHHNGIHMRAYLRAANVSWSGLILDDVKQMNFTDKEMDTYRLHPGDLLLNEASGSAREVGKPAIWSGEIADCGFQNTLLRVRPRGPEPRFLLHFFRHQALSGRFANRSRGVGIYHLGRKALASLPVFVPPLADQRRIVAILDETDALSSKRRRSLALIDSLTESIFLDMFGDPVTNPMGWPNPTVGGALAKIEYGHRFYNQPYCKEGTRVVRITDLSESGVLAFEAMPRMAITAEDHSRYVLQPGDLIFARSGATVGKVALVREGDPECIAGAYFVWLRFLDEIEPTYARALLASQSVRAIISRTSRQAAQQNFSGPAIKRLPMPVPPKDLQRHFVQRVSELELVREKCSKGAGRLDELFASLQHRAFRGEL